MGAGIQLFFPSTLVVPDSMLPARFRGSPAMGQNLCGGMA